MFITNLIRRRRIVELNGKFMAQILILPFVWEAIDRDVRYTWSDLKHQIQYCLCDTYEEAAALFPRYYDLRDEQENRRRLLKVRSKKKVHSAPPMEPKAWRILKQNNQKEIK